MDERNVPLVGSTVWCNISRYDIEADADVTCYIETTTYAQGSFAINVADVIPATPSFGTVPVANCVAEDGSRYRTFDTSDEETQSCGPITRNVSFD